MKAVAVGAGIAGLVAARQLGLAGWDVELLGKSVAPRPDGYMMDFFGPGVEAAGRIGLYPRLAAVAHHVEAAEYVDAAGRPTMASIPERAQVFGPEEDYLHPLGMRAAAFIVAEPLLNARFRNRFVLTDSIDGRQCSTPSAQTRWRHSWSTGMPQARRGTSDPGVRGSGCAASLPDSAPRVLVGDACGAVSLLAGQGTGDCERTTQSPGRSPTTVMP